MVSRCIVTTGISSSFAGGYGVPSRCQRFLEEIASHQKLWLENEEWIAKILSFPVVCSSKQPMTQPSFGFLLQPNGPLILFVENRSLRLIFMFCRSSVFQQRLAFLWRVFKAFVTCVRIQKGYVWAIVWPAFKFFDFATKICSSVYLFRFIIYFSILEEALDLWVWFEIAWFFEISSFTAAL